jgi:hypothetical protein
VGFINSTVLPRADYYPVVHLPESIEVNLPYYSEIRKKISSTQTSNTFDRKQRFWLKVSGVFMCLGGIVILLGLFKIYDRKAITLVASIAYSASFLFILNTLYGQQSQPAIDRYYVVPEWYIPNWDDLLQGRILTPDRIGGEGVRQGISEVGFERYLAKIFGNALQPSYSFAIPNTDLFYTTDFTLILPCGLYLCIEIDEPYSAITGEPIHCIDDERDLRRDRFFNAGNWIVIRFSELQAVNQPLSCCYFIAEQIDRIARDGRYLERFEGEIERLKLDRRWTKGVSLQMVRDGYRLGYLKGGVEKPKLR